MKVSQIYRIAEQTDGESGLPLLPPIAAGWPSPAEDYIEDVIDLHKMLIRNPASTYMVKVSGHSMKDVGIMNDGVMLVDKSLAAKNGSNVVVSIDGELLVKKLVKRDGRVFLAPENPDFKTIEITGRDDVRIWGVVISSITTFKE